MLTAIAGNGTKTIIVETANRFARDLFVQLTGHRILRKLGVELIAANSPDAFIEDTPTAALIRNVLGAVSEFEKASLVAKLKGARDRKRRETGKCGGRRAHSELSPDVVSLAKKLRRKGKTLRAISAELAAAGYVNRNGRPYHSKSVLEYDRVGRPPEPATPRAPIPTLNTRPASVASYGSATGVSEPLHRVDCIAQCSKLGGTFGDSRAGQRTLGFLPDGNEALILSLAVRDFHVRRLPDVTVPSMQLRLQSPPQSPSARIWQPRRRRHPPVASPCPPALTVSYAKVLLSNDSRLRYYKTRCVSPSLVEICQFRA